MAVEERQRHLLHQKLETVMGSDAADIMMAHLPPTGWADLATRADVETSEVALRADLERVETGLRADLERVETGLRADLERVETGLRADLERREAALRVDLQQVEADLRLLREVVEYHRKDTARGFARLDERLEERLDTAVATLRADFHGEINQAVLSQTRTTIFALVGAFVAVTGLAMVLAGFGG